MMKQIFINLFALIAFSEAAFAQDLCKDILVNGSLSIVSQKENTFFEQFVAARQQEKTRRENEQEVESSATIPLGEIVMGGSFNAKDYNHYLREWSNSLDLRTLFKNESSVLLASGDPVIVDAWKTCMGKGRGLSLIFDVQSPTTALLETQWFAYPVAPGVANTTILTSDVVLPKDNVTVVSGSECLQKGLVLHDKVPCITQLEFGKGSVSLAVVVRTQHGSESAFLPPRLKLVPQRQGYVPTTHTGNPNPMGIYTLGSNRSTSVSCFEAPKGWSFVNASINVRTWVGGTLPKSKCKAEITTLAETTVCYQLHAGHTGHDGYCHGQLETEIIKWNVVESIN